MKGLPAVGVVGLVLGSVLFTATASGQTLEEALASAYLNNPELQAQRAQLRQVDEQVPQALSGWRPSAEAFGELGVRRRTFRGDVGGSDSQNLTPREIGGRIVQPLFRGGRTIAATRAAENAVMAARARLLDAQQRVLLAAVSAYVNVLAAQAVVEFEVQNEQRLQRFFQATGDRFDVGEVTRTDVFQSEARLARSTADRLQREGELQVARAEFLRIIGMPPGALQLPTVPPQIPDSLTEAVELASANNPELLAAEYDERRARDRVDQVRGELLPELNLTGEASTGVDAAGDNIEADDLRAAVNLTVPLYQSGAVYSRLREAKQIVAEARDTVNAQRRLAIRDATQAWNEFEAAQAQDKAFGTEVRANEIAVEGVEREQAVGTRTVLDVLDTQQDLIDSQRSLVLAKRDVIRFAYELMSATGTLTAGELQLPVQQYEPGNHYQQVRGKWFGGDSIGDMNDPAFVPAVPTRR
ncbi:MAG: TolC family outer membrane protein [Rhodospirillales bacterium]|nr:TolC family outer membrane protein [Rhodospirillales bacterium]